MSLFILISNSRFMSFSYLQCSLVRYRVNVSRYYVKCQGGSVTWSNFFNASKRTQSWFFRGTQNTRKKWINLHPEYKASVKQIETVKRAALLSPIMKKNSIWAWFLIKTDRSGHYYMHLKNFRRFQSQINNYCIVVPLFYLKNLTSPTNNKGLN